VASHRQNLSIGILLSGTGHDGTEGAAAIKGVGGIVFAQSPETAKFDPMPRSAIASGQVDHTLSPAEIADEIFKLSRNSEFMFEATDHSRDAEEAQGFKEILAELHDKIGVDFTGYKQSTIIRRIRRRIAIVKADTAAEYLKIIRNNDAELNKLYRDFLINVTCFFRDAEIFEALA